jgi:polyisoprenyl-phosphate glycosyltransferase
MTLIDIVVAVRNEELSIIPFIESIRRIRLPECSVRMIFVEDGSNDGTSILLKKLAATSDDIAFYSIFNPYGQGYALSYGILQSNADALITMDVDSSHPVDVAKEMIEKYRLGFDVVQGKRIIYDNRPVYRRTGSFLYVLFFSLISTTNFFEQNVHFRLMNRTALDVFIKNKSWWYTTRTGFKKNDNLKIYNLNFTAPERFLGESKFNMKRIISAISGSFVTLVNPIIGLIINLMLASLGWVLFALPVFLVSLVSLVVINILLLNKRVSLTAFEESYLVESKPFKQTINKTN